MRLVNADALRKCFEAEYEVADGIQVSMDRYALKCIDNAPTINAEPVVRCGECKWSKPYSDKQLKCNALGLGGLKFLNDFCSYGKRREP